MKVLLFGASGFLGQHLLGSLAREGHAVTATTRRAAAVTGATAETTFDLLRGSMPALGGHDAAVFSAQSRLYRGNIDRADVFGVNAYGVARAAELARRCGVKRFVLMSTGSVYGLGAEAFREDAALMGAGAYPESKRQGEEIIRLYRDDFEVVILRLFTLYGAGQVDRLIPDLVGRVKSRSALTLQPLVAGEADDGLVVTLAHVSDTARAIELALGTLPPDVYNVGDDSPISIRSIGETIGEALGIEPIFEVAGERSGNLIASTTKLSEASGFSTRGPKAGLREYCHSLTAG